MAAGRGFAKNAGATGSLIAVTTCTPPLMHWMFASCHEGGYQ
jgi:hypothetical protein